MLLGPMKFEPILKERIWGSDRLGSLLGKKFSEGKKIGESWELVDLSGDCSRIVRGSFAGRYIREVLQKHGQDIGYNPDECEFPFGLLVKFLDANDVLSVQVHPDSRTCDLFAGAQMKTEFWYVLEAEANAVIYRGLKPGIGRTKVGQAVKDGTLQGLLKVYPAQQGDTHYLPAGTIHALGAGVMVVEIQTPSDSTFRLFDWNRVDEQGRGRELHIEEALSCIHYTDDSGEETRGNKIDTPPSEDLIKLGETLGNSKLLVKCPFFSIVHLRFQNVGVRHFEVKRPVVMINLKGAGMVSNALQGNNIVGFTAGDTLLWPRMNEGIVKTEIGFECLLVCLGPVRVN
ncbi:MAG: hypothetical protein GY869_08900 [Planctomycetes bacterium]|nr:hypothetical protein [Planctomycetota bacterium]